MQKMLAGFPPSDSQHSSRPRLSSSVQSVKILERKRMPEAEDPSLPTLFPSKLLDCCLETVQRMVLMAGTRTERRAKLILERDK